jgi:hypothetical protein
MAKKAIPEKTMDGADPKLSAIASVLERYEVQHPGAKAEARRYNSASIRVRIIDPRFEGTSRADRDKELWELLEPLPEDTIADLTMLALLAPSEMPTSLANREFEHPSPSRL